MRSAILFLLVTCCAAQDDQLTLDNRAYIASQMYASISHYFAHWHGTPIDLDAEYRVYLHEALASADRRAFDLASMAFVGKLNNGHSWFGDWWLRRESGQSLGFYAHPMGGEWTVTESAVADLHVGDVVVSIDGEPIAEFYKRLKRYLFASDERWRERALFDSPFFFPREFTLELQDTRKVRVTRSQPFSFHGDALTANEVSQRGEVAIVRIPSFSKPVFESSAVDAIRKIGEVRALILDVRGNHGGSLTGQLASALMTATYRNWSQQTSAAVGLFQSWGVIGPQAALTWTGGSLNPQRPVYSGPLFILTDDGCYSACENLVMPFKDNHRAQIIGERTAGSSGQTFIKDFGNGMAIGVNTMRYSFPDGAEFEGVGIEPDVEVHVTAADLRAGRDAILDTAIKLALQK